MVESDGWEFVRRAHGNGVVGVMALTADGSIVLVEQFRTPVGCSVIELPAGLIGDQAPETALEAAQRELLEETGYQAGRFEHVVDGPSSAGLTDECVTLVRAYDVERVAKGGGVDDEQITVHEVPLDSLSDWLAAQERTGRLVDLKVRLAPTLLGTPLCPSE